MSLFGASASTNPATGTGNIFGSNPSTNTGGSIFGNTNTNNQPNGQTSSIFANSLNNQQQQPQQQNQQPSTSVFGNPAANTGGNTGNSLFGNTQGSGLFGAKPAGTTAPGTTGSTGGGLFGNTTGANTNTGGLFGNTAATQPAGLAGTNSFFSTPPAGQQQQQQQQQNGNANQPKPGLFGNPLFNNNNAANTNAGTGSLFGGANTNTTTAPTNSLFGASTSGGGLFGNTATNTNTTGGAFGSSTLGASTLGTSTLGNNVLGTSALSKPAGGLGGSSLGVSTLGSSSFGAQNQGQDAQVQFLRLQEKMQAIIGAWNAQDPTQCRFQHYFYNLVDPSQIHMYTRPPTAVKEDLWQKAVRENPDPSCLVPVLALGFDDLRGRVEAQTQQSTAHKEKLTELQTRLRTLTTHHTTETIPRLQRYSAFQTQLLHRLLKLVQHLHLLIPSVRSSAIGEGEEELRSQLEGIAAEVGISRPSASGDNNVRKGGRLKSKLGELWAVIGALKAREEGLSSMTGGGEWKVVDEEGLMRITQILAEQQAGLVHLTKILQKDLKDLAIIMGTETSNST